MVIMSRRQRASGALSVCSSVYSTFPPALPRLFPYTVRSVWPPLTPMSSAGQAMAVLFADVSGSTRLYEQVGNATALATIGECMALVQAAAGGHAGRLVKTIGDEAMVVFPTANQAAAAAG